MCDSLRYIKTNTEKDRQTINNQNISQNVVVRYALSTCTSRETLWPPL